MGVSAIQGLNNIGAGNYPRAAMNGLDMSVSSWSLISPAASWGGALYFSVGAFYPGGWNGAMQMNGSLIQQNQQIIPDFNLYRDYP